MGCITDFDGFYEIRVPANQQTLSFSYSGYQTMEVAINAAKNNYVNTTLCKETVGEVEVRATDDPFQVKTYPDATTNAPLVELLAKDLLILLDGKRYDAATMGNLTPEAIQEIKVVKQADELKKLGYGTDFKGAILITTKE
ncbi:MAG: carboxypeptidase-like regulatory domain-containing protein [Bacteroidota bacterium]